MRLLDSIGDELTYWAISGLIEGEDSEVLDFTIEGLLGGPQSIYANLDARANVWVRKVGDASYTNVSLTPYVLDGIIGDRNFQCYIEALTPISGLERIPFTITSGTSSPAGWVE